MENANDITISQDSKNMAILMWVLSIFLGFLASLIFFFVKKDDEYVLAHSKEALNWGITAIIGYFVGAILIIILIGGFIMLAVVLANLVFCIMGAIAASSGKSFKVPFAIRLIK